MSVNQQVPPASRIQFHTIKANPPIGGRIKHFLKNWEILTQDPWVLETVSGYKLEFVQLPFQEKIPNAIKFSKEETVLVRQEIDQLLQKCAIRQVPSYQCHFQSNLFLVPKKGGGQRPVVNLRQLNTFLSYEHFKMEGIHMVRDLIIQNDFMGKLDLKDAYLMIPIIDQHQKYLGFTWENQSYLFRSLAFGLAPAPRVFTKVMKPVVGLFRRLGIRLIIYLDDMLVMNKCVSGLQEDLRFVRLTLENLGLVINVEKSQLLPVQKIEFLGYIVDSVSMTLSLPRAKIDKIKKKCNALLREPSTTVRKVSSLLGCFTDSLQAFFQAPLHYRMLQKDKHLALNQNKSYESKVQLSPGSIEEIKWWISNLEALNGRAILTPVPELSIETDASRQGWGAFCKGVSIGGHWSPSEEQLHINALELLAATLAIKAFVKDKSNMAVLLQMDNRSSVAYINRLGGTKSTVLTELAKELWDWALPRKIHISAVHIPGTSNTRADIASRYWVDTSDWQLDKNIFKEITKRFGPFDIDLFANRLNNQLPRYCSWKPDPGAVETDAFSIHWTNLKGYAFPPFSLIGKCLAQIRAQSATIVIIAPVWQTQPWFALLLEMSISLPILLPPYKSLLTSPRGDIHPLVTNGSLHLAAWHVSGNLALVRDFQTELPLFSWHHGARVQTQVTIAPGVNGVAGVTHEKLIRFEPLWLLS